MPAYINEIEKIIHKHETLNKSDVLHFSFFFIRFLFLAMFSYVYSITMNCQKALVYLIYVNSMPKCRCDSVKKTKQNTNNKTVYDNQLYR